jgi:hypothetical protein
MFVADNKDIRDLMTNAAVFTIEYLTRLAFQRGIVVSKSDTREDIIKYMSMLSLDKKQLDELLLAATPHERHPASTARTYPKLNVTADDLCAAVEKLIGERAATHNETVKYHQSGDNVVIKIEYVSFTASRNRLQQERQTHAEIEMNPQTGSLHVRSTPGPRAAEFVDGVVELIAKEKKQEQPQARKINLTGIKIAEARSQFFLGILKNLKGFGGEEVSDIRVNLLEEEDDDEPDDADSSDDDGGVMKKPRFQKQANQLKSKLKHASLVGTDLLTDPVFQGLSKSGFHISRIAWKCTSKRDGSIAELEAWFQEPNEAKNLCYKVRSYAEKDNSDKGNPRLGAAKFPDPTVERTLLAVIEDAAQQSLSDVESKYTQQPAVSR